MADNLPVQTENATPAVQDNSPLAIIERAIEIKADPAQVEKWMEIVVQHERREAEKAYARAMHACQGTMPKVWKSQTNAHTRTKYADLEGVQNTTRPVYYENGFSLSFGEEPCPVDDYKRTVCDVIHVSGHIQRYHLDLPVDGKGSQGGKSSMNAVQGCISTTSYAQRRLICMIFNITLTKEDNDGQPTQTITEEQAIELQDICTQLDVATIQRACKYYKVESWYDLTADRFDEAKANLAKKAQEAGK